MAIKSKADLTYIREINKAEILKVIRENEQASRSKIFKITGLGWATVTKFVGELIKEGLVMEVGKEGNFRGRKTVLLEVNPKAGYFIGVDLGINNITVAVTDFEGRIITRLKNRTRREIGPREIFRKTVKYIKDTIDSSGIDVSRIKGIGVAIPGIIDFRNGVVVEAPNLKGWKNVPIREWFEKKFQFPVFIDRNARAMLIAERWFGAARGVDNLIYINLGMGVSAAFIFNGQIFRGESGSVGEFGHTFIAESDVVCACGRKGCVETFVSGPAIVRQAVESLNDAADSEILKLAGNKEDITAETVFLAARKGDAKALEVFRNTGKHLGVAIGNMVNLLNPDMVIVGGGVARAGGLLLDNAKESLDKRAMEVPRKAVKILTTQLSEDGGVIGAAGLVFHELYEPPTIEKQ